MPNRSIERPLLRAGEPFNPFGLFHGVFIPEALVRSTRIPAGAKLAYGRLCRYAGENGRCFPAVGTLAREIGVSDRQAQRYLAELERAQLIRRVERFVEGGQISNNIEFLWHHIFEARVTDGPGEGVTDMSSPGVTDMSPKESQIQESQSEESSNGDLDYPPTNRKKSDSPPEAASPSQPRNYSKLKGALAQYMASDGGERIYPSDRLVVDVMDAAEGEPEEEVLRCLRYLLRERGLRPGTKHAPRHFAWFKTVVAEYFAQKHQRDYIVNPGRYGAWAEGTVSGLPKEQFDRMTEVL